MLGFLLGRRLSSLRLRTSVSSASSPVDADSAVNGPLLSPISQDSVTTVFSPHGLYINLVAIHITVALAILSVSGGRCCITFYNLVA